MGGSVKKAATVANPFTGGGLIASDAVSGGKASGLFGGALGVGKELLGQKRFKGSVTPVREKAFDIADQRELSENAKRFREEARQQSRRTGEIQENLRTGRTRLIEDLQRQAAGQGPSLAQEQLKQAQDRSLKQQLAAAGRSRGASAAATQRALMRSQVEQGQALGREAAQARMQEQLAARQQLAGAITGGQQVEQQRKAMEDSQIEKYLALGFNMNQAQQQAQADLEALRVKQELGAQGLLQSSFDAAQDRRMQVGGGLLQGVAAALSDKKMKKNIKKEGYSSMSDENKKINKKPKKDFFNSISESIGKATNPQKESAGNQAGQAIGKALAEGAKSLMSQSDKNSKKDIKKNFLDKLTAYSYEYKDPKAKGAGEGRHYSVMAQDLEKAGPVGKSMVKEENGTKMVDYGKGFGAILAAQASLNERLNQLEKKKRK